MHSFRIVTMVVVLGLLGMLAGCAGHDTVTVHISKEQIQERLAAQFPIEKRELLFKAVFSEPQIRLKPDSEKVGVEAKTVLQVTRNAAITGHLSLDSDLRYEPATGEFFLKNIRLVDAHIETVPPQVAPVVKLIGGLPTLQRIFDEVCAVVPPKISDVKLGQLPDDWKGRAAQAVIRSVAVKENGLDIEVGLPQVK